MDVMVYSIFYNIIIQIKYKLKIKYIIYIYCIFSDLNFVNNNNLETFTYNFLLSPRFENQVIISLKFGLLICYL